MNSPEASPTRLVVTEIGLVTPLGLSAHTNVARSLQGESAIRSAGGTPLAGCGCRAIARVPDFELGGLQFPKNERYMNRPVRFALRAIRDALEDSDLRLDHRDSEAIALYTASGQTGLEPDEFFRALDVAWGSEADQDYGKVGGRASRLIDRYFSLRTLANAGVGLLSTELGIRGSGANFVQGNTASVFALQSACFDLLDGTCDVALATSYDSLLSPTVYLAYESAGLLSHSEPEEAGRPFDVRRNGIVLGEGAGTVTLERMDDATAREATILAEIIDVVAGSATEQRAVSGSSPASGWEAVREAVARHGCDFVVANGLGTVEGDRTEARTLARIVGPDIPVTAFKGQTGFLGAASALVEFGLAVLCVRAGKIPAVARLGDPDPEFGIDLVRDLPRPVSNRSLTGVFISKSLSGEICAIIARISP